MWCWRRLLRVPWTARRSNVVVVQSLSCVWLFTTPWTAARQASLSLTISQSLLKLLCVELVMPSKYLVLCHPLLLLPSIFPRVFCNLSGLRIKWPKYWTSASASVLPMNIQDWFPLGLKLKLQHFGHWDEELTYWKRTWCWEKLRAGGEEGNRGWDGWMASLTQWTWVWANSRSWWRTGKPGMVQSMESQRVRHDRAMEQQKYMHTHTYTL